MDGRSRNRDNENSCHKPPAADCVCLFTGAHLLP